MNIKCFLLRPTGADREYLRRYARDAVTPKCSGRYGYHNAMVEIGTSPEGTHIEPPPHDHPKWPRKCDHCDYLFDEQDYWQLFRQHLFLRSDLPASEGLTTIEDAPPGAMWLADWYGTDHGSAHFLAMPEEIRRRGHLIVKCPGGHEWDVDSPASNGSGWTRRGDPPMVTATPSILTPEYHGFLTNGELVGC